MTSWQTPLCPFTIGFAAEKLDEIRIAVVDGFYKVPRGGVEVGGVLFGKRKEGWLLITDFRQVDTEYLSGPSFQLSRNDREGLKKMLAEASFDDPAIEPLGLFVSHTRSKINLAARDLELYQEFFPEPWQVALVLKPENLGQVRAGYFFRDKSGALKADVSALEFVVEPAAGAKRGEERVPAPVVLAAAAAVTAAPVIPRPQPIAEQPLPPVPQVPKVEPAQPAPPPQERLLFQFIGQGDAWGWKRILYLLLTIAAVLSACGGYWLAVRGNQ